MLDACAELIAEFGYEGTTTTLIAERAGVAVGSLYQFFPDKRAVVQSLTLRNMERFLANVVQQFEAVRLEHWWGAIDSIFDVYISMHREAPAFRRLHFGDVVDLRLLEDDRENNVVIAERLAELVAERFQLKPEELLLPFAVAIEAADAVLNLAFRRDPQGDPVVVNEAREMVRVYLSSRLGD
jgi:AcrR family transcriptional regulator